MSPESGTQWETFGTYGRMGCQVLAWAMKCSYRSSGCWGTGSAPLLLHCRQVIIAVVALPALSNHHPATEPVSLSPCADERYRDTSTHAKHDTTTARRDARNQSRSPALTPIDWWLDLQNPLQWAWGSFIYNVRCAQSATPCGTSDTNGTRGPTLWVFPARCHYPSSKCWVIVNGPWRSHLQQVHVEFAGDVINTTELNDTTTWNTGQNSHETFHFLLLYFCTETQWVVYLVKLLM